MSVIKFFFFQLIYFLMVFAPIYGGIDLLFIVAFLFCVYGTFKMKSRLLFSSCKFFYILIPLFLYLMVNAALLYSDISIYNVFFLLLKPVRIIVTAMGCFVLIWQTYKSYGTDFFKYSFLLVFGAIFIHAIIMTYEVINPQFRIYLQNTLFAGMDTRGSFNENFRMGGLMGPFGGAVTSVVQASGVLIVPFLIKFINSKIIKGLHIFMTLIIVFSVLSCGRSGLWAILIFLPLIIFFQNRKNIVKLSIWGVVLGVLIIGSLSIVVNYTAGGSGDNESVQKMFGRTLDTFIEYEETGSFQDETVSGISKMIQLPGAYELLFGDATHILTNDEGRILKSDIGYIRDLWSMGILGLLLYILPYLKMLKRMYVTRKQIFSACAFTLLLLTLFFNMKEMFLYCRCLFSIVMLIYFTAVISSKQQQSFSVKISV